MKAKKGGLNKQDDPLGPIDLALSIHEDKHDSPKRPMAPMALRTQRLHQANSPKKILVCKPCPCGKPCTAHELNPAEAYCSHSLPRMGIHEWTREEMELEEEEQEERSYLDYMELGVGEDLREDRDIPFYLAKTLERCKKVGIATGPQMLNLTVMEKLVEGVQRKQVEQKPPSEPQSKEDAVKVQSADESEEPQKSPLGRRGEDIMDPHV